MSDYHLVVSNPPHTAVQPQVAAKTLGCSAADARIKTAFPAPEIWLAEPAGAEGRQKAEALVNAGLRVVLARGSVLAAVPAVSWATAVKLDDAELVVETEAGGLKLALTDRVVAVIVEPPKQDKRMTPTSGSFLAQKLPGHGPMGRMGLGIAQGAGLAGLAAQPALDKLDQVVQQSREDMKKRVSDVGMEPEPALFMDLYAYAAGIWHCVRFSTGRVDFAGLGKRMKSTMRENLWAVFECFENSVVDERLVKVNYRQQVVSGMAMPKLLAEIDADLALLPPMDVGSRLAFLTSKGKLGQK
jgi:hypothetical protein